MFMWKCRSYFVHIPYAIPFLPREEEIKWITEQITQLKKKPSSEETKEAILELEAILSKKQAPKITKKTSETAQGKVTSTMHQLEHSRNIEEKKKAREEYNKTKLATKAYSISLNLEVLHFINEILRDVHFSEEIHIKECACAQHFDRRGSQKSVRDSVDELAVKHVQATHPKDSTITLLSIGSGNLKQDLTIAGNLMKAGYNIKLILVDKNYVGLPKVNSDGSLQYSPQEHAYAGTFQQFRQISEKLQQKYGKKIEIAGCFSGIEPYEAIITGKPLKLITKEKIESVTRLLNDATGNQLVAPDENTLQNNAINAAYQQEVQYYQESCKLAPDLVTAVDVKDEFRPDFQISPQFESAMFGAGESKKLEGHTAFFNKTCNDLFTAIGDLSPSHAPLFLTTHKNSATKLVTVNVDQVEPNKPETQLESVDLNMFAEVISSKSAHKA